MAPLQDHVPKDFKPPHRARAHVAPGMPSQFYGRCDAGDFESNQMRATADAAVADVDQHMREVSQQMASQ